MIKSIRINKFRKLENIFSGGKKYKEILKQYNKSINEIL